MSKRIAVIGSGISGLVSASLLSQRYDVTLFEANNYLGGHTCTIDVELGHQQYAIDTGFVVFNKKTYPNFSRLMDKYNIPIQPSEMSFSFCSDSIEMEYNGHTINTLFADRRNLVKPVFYRFIKDILRFNQDAKKYVLAGASDTTIEEFATRHSYQPLFVEAYLVPVIAAIWSKKAKDVLKCSARFILKFFEDHGLLSVYQRPPWYVIAGGSRNYIPPLIQNFKNNIHLNTKIERLERYSDHVIVKTKDEHIRFDAAVMTLHSDQALKILDAPTEDEQTILGAIPYTENEVILHTDTSILPKKRLAWASWNYRDVGSEHATLTYYMNKLQNLSAPEHICLSVNLTEKISPEKILRRFTYAHPRFTQEALQAQTKRELINGKQNTYFAGAYWGFGFHEDGVNSALEVCRLLGVEI